MGRLTRCLETWPAGSPETAPPSFQSLRVPYRDVPWHSGPRLSPFRDFRESSERDLFQFGCKSGWLQQLTTSFRRCQVYHNVCARVDVF
jgi:hypothetical protein